MATALAAETAPTYRQIGSQLAGAAPALPTTVRLTTKAEQNAYRREWFERRSRIVAACGRQLSRRLLAEWMRTNLAPGEAHTFGAE